MSMALAHPEPTPSLAEILVVGGRPFVFGIRWTSAVARSSLDAEATLAAMAEGASHIVLHRAYNQFGLASVATPATGFGRWFYSPRAGVAQVALAAGAATLAAFPLDDGRWLVLAIDRKGFLPDGDVIVAGEEQARARIDQLIAQSPTSWRRKFVPDAWGIPDGKAANPADLLAGSGAPRLIPLWRLVQRRRIRFGVGSAGLAAVAGIFAAVRIAIAPTPPRIMPVQQPKPVAAVWTPAGLALDQCLKGFRSADRYHAVPGWLPTKYSCQGGETVAVTFARRGDGQISIIRALVPEARLSDDGRAAVVTFPLGPLAHISATGAFAPRERYRLIALDLSQRLNGAFSLQAARAPLPGETRSVPPNQSWTLLGWSYQTSAPAPVWATAIARLGAIAIDTLVYSPGENLWQVSGSLYASN
jgi:hypothetical protein